jgi:hypothetical protein
MVFNRVTVNATIDAIATETNEVRIIRLQSAAEKYLAIILPIPDEYRITIPDIREMPQ